jgi:methylphosphotriester-DNA--protein-cysteine methyltransferase
LPDCSGAANLANKPLTILQFPAPPDQTAGLETGTTERTLSRRSRDELGMSFNEWRQRQKLVAALALLDAGQPVQQVDDNPATAIRPPSSRCFAA